MPKDTPLSHDRANKDIAITRSALLVRDTRTRFTRQNAKQDNTSMPKASPLCQDKAINDTATTRESRCAKTVRPPSSPSPSNQPATKLARVRSPSSPSPINMTTTKLARVRPPSSPSPSNQPATKLARLRSQSPPSPCNVTATKLADINVTSVNDKKTCRITGSAIMNDNRLIIADDSNNKLILINTNTNKIMAILDVSARREESEIYNHPAAVLLSMPWDVAAIDNHQSAVTLPHSKQILVVKVTDTIVKEREITVRGICMGVTYSRGRLLVTYNGTPKLEIMDLDGTVTRTIELDTYGNTMLLYPYYVCVSKDGEMVYVSDYGRHTVTSLTLDGVVKAVYKDKEFALPGKVCTDHHGNVYVCSSGNRYVHMLTADLKKVKVILTRADGLENPVWSLSHCQDTNRLFIGMESNTLQSYQLA